MATLGPCVHGQTPLLTLLSCLLSHAPREGSLGEMSQVRPHLSFHSLLSVAVCMCVCTHKCTDWEDQRATL